jgi:hypothetical protein
MAGYLNFSQPWTYQSATAKKAAVKKRASRSHIKASPGMAWTAQLSQWPYVIFIKGAAR